MNDMYVQLTYYLPIPKGLSPKTTIIIKSTDKIVKDVLSHQKVTNRRTMLKAPELKPVRDTQDEGAEHQHQNSKIKSNHRMCLFKLNSKL